MERYGVCVCVNIHKEAILSKVPNAPPLQDACVCVFVCWEKGTGYTGTCFWKVRERLDKIQERKMMRVVMVLLILVVVQMVVLVMVVVIKLVMVVVVMAGKG